MGLRRATAARRGFPWSAQAAAAAGWVASGALVLVLACGHVAASGTPAPAQAAFAVVFGALLAANWVWPARLRVDGLVDTHGLDEGYFVVLILLVPATLTVVAFALAAFVASAVRRRPLVASACDMGWSVTSAGLAAAVFVLVLGSHGATGYAGAGAAVLGAMSYFLVETVASASIAAVSGVPWRGRVLNGIGARLLVAGGAVAAAIPTALLVAQDPAFLPVAVVSLLVLRAVGEGHLSARNERMRLRGLFEATLDVNRSIGDDETRAAVLGSAGSLLRSSDVRLEVERPPRRDDTIAAPVQLSDRRLWLSVSARSCTEPFDDADRALLDALASVGSVALANADLYAQVEREKERLSLIATSLGEGVCAVSRTSEITFVNPTAAAMLGWSSPDGSIETGIPSEAPRFLSDPAMRAMGSGQTVVTEGTRFERADGAPFPVTMTASPVLDGGVPSAAVIVFRDISDRQAFEEQLARHAFGDPLTGLANRRLLLDHLDHALLQAERSGTRVAVLFGDIDRFKVVNDHLGHQVGDELLKVVADRLRRAVRPGDTLSRFGGDEFVVVIEGVTCPDDAGNAADRVLHALVEPVVLSAGHEVVVTMSIGLALSERGSTREDLLHNADVAMYRAKERGRGGHVTLFDDDRIKGRSAARLDLDTALHHAVERGEVGVHYQPLVSLTEQRIVGAEALLRWDHPEHGILAPSQFMQLAEDNGTILSIGLAVLEQACRQANVWHDVLGSSLGIGVNLSARQFQQPGLDEQVAAVLDATGFEPAQLCLEIAESLAMEDVETTTVVLTKLHSLGVQLAIDDFGTGHSSLGYLARFPIDVIKIDQSFVRDIDHDPVKSAIVSAVVALSRAIGSTTVVEGVETQPELEHLENLGCHVAQGFYFSRPVPPHVFETLLEEGLRSPGRRRVPRRTVLTG